MSYLLLIQKFFHNFSFSLHHNDAGVYILKNTSVQWGGGAWTWLRAGKKTKLERKKVQQKHAQIIKDNFGISVRFKMKV